MLISYCNTQNQFTELELPPAGGIIGYDESLKTVLDKICYVFDIRYVAEGELYRLID